MSLCCFGKIIAHENVTIERQFLDYVQIGIIDKEDAYDLDTDPRLKGAGSYFTIVDGPMAGEATGLWNEAYETPAELRAESVLARIVRSLIMSPRVARGGIAFVDGGVETVVLGTKPVCWAAFVDRLALPWHALDNPLFIWSDE